MSESYLEEDALWEGKFDRDIFLRLVAYVRPHLKLVGVVGVLVLLTTLFHLALPYFLRLIIDDVNPGLTTKTFWGMTSGKGELFRWFALAYLLCEILRLPTTTPSSSCCSCWASG